MEPENDGLKIGISSSKGSCSGSMLVFEGVSPLFSRRFFLNIPGGTEEFTLRGSAFGDDHLDQVKKTYPLKC